MSKIDDLISELDTAAGMLIVTSMKDETVRAAMEKITHVSVKLGIIASGEGTTEVERQKQLTKCDWCDEQVEQISHPHMFDMAIGKRMCRNCWDHDRTVYKGSYGEDIGPFRPIEGEKKE